jgi:hypothetical protein
MSEVNQSKQGRSMRPITDMYAEILELQLSYRERIKRGLRPGATWAHAIAFAMVKAAANGNVQAARELREAVEGKAPQRLPDSADYYDTEVKVVPIREASNQVQETFGEPARAYGNS